MQEKVCIVLNEREPQKARAVEALLNRLSEFNITASRLEASENLAQIIAQRQPKVLILDYLLEGFGTGLDILSALNSHSSSKRPKTIFLTDEPSVPVAVEAMRLGASNYYELDNPQSIGRLARETFEIIQNSAYERPVIKISEHKLDDFLAHSQSSHKLVGQARVLAAKRPPLLVIEGAPGSGRSTLAKAIYLEGKHPTALEIVDLASCSESFVWHPLDDESELISRNKFIIVRNPEEDDGSLIDLIRSKQGVIWPNDSAAQSNLQIVVCSSEPETSRAWQKIVAADLLKIPGLAERKEDVPLLVQRFIKEAQDLSGVKSKAFSAEVINWLSKLDWPGEIRQLRATIIHAAIDTALAESDPKEVLSSLRETWSEQKQNYNYSNEISALAAAMAFEIASGNYRIAAARLGISVRDLRSKLQ